MTAYYDRPEYRSAVAHPYYVQLWASWDAAEPVTVGFQSEDDARAFAASRPEPIIDLVRRDDGIIAYRRLIAYPGGSPSPGLHDDFPPTE